MQRHFSSMLHTLMWAQCWMAGTCDGGDLHRSPKFNHPIRLSLQLQFYNLSIFRNMNAVCLAMHYDFSAQGRTGNLIVADTFKMGCHEGSLGRIVHCLQDIGNVHDDINQQHEIRKFMDELAPSSWHGLLWQKVRTECLPTLPSPRLARNMARLPLK